MLRIWSRQGQSLRDVLFPEIVLKTESPKGIPSIYSVAQLGFLVVSAALVLLRMGCLQNRVRQSCCPFPPRQWAIIRQKVKQVIIHGSGTRLGIYDEFIHTIAILNYHYPNNILTLFEQRYTVFNFGCSSYAYSWKPNASVRTHTRICLKKDDAITTNLIALSTRSPG